MTVEVTVEQAIASARTQSGRTLSELSATSPVLLVFLRHSGCPFCRQALSELSRLRSELEAAHAQLVIVHQDAPERGAAWISRYDLGQCEQISDPAGHLYSQFQLGKANLWNLIGPHTWWAGFKASILQMHGIGKVVGDIRQLTGAFVIQRGKIVKAFKQKISSDQANYRSMVCDI